VFYERLQRITNVFRFIKLLDRV